MTRGPGVASSGSRTLLRPPAPTQETGTRASGTWASASCTAAGISPRTTATGRAAAWTTAWLTEPSSRLVNAPPSGADHDEAGVRALGQQHVGRMTLLEPGDHRQRGVQAVDVLHRRVESCPGCLQL